MTCKKEGLFDRHHIIPKYMGGSNDFTNIVVVSRTCHTMFHYCNWCLWKNREDYIAYKGLSSQISKEDIIKETSRLAGKKCYEKKVGMFTQTEEEKRLSSSKGGKKVGKYMSQSMWINNGIQNKRVLRSNGIPDGWYKGKVKKEKKTKYNKTREEYIKSFDEQVKNRLDYLKNVDLSEWGIKTKIAKDWGISRTQLNRFLEKHYYSREPLDNPPPTVL